MNENVAAVPGMPWIEKFAAIGTVGLTLSSCTTLAVHIWPWGQVCPIRRPHIVTNERRDPATDARNRASCVPNRSSAACTTNIQSRPRLRDRFLAHYNQQAPPDERAVAAEHRTQLINVVARLRLGGH
jgi:hypothetical protein